MLRTGDTEGTRWSSDVERSRGYRDAVVAAGLELRDDYVVTRHFGVTAGADGIDLLRGLDDPPTAVFCYSDEVAFGAIHQLLRHGVRIPEELSLIGVDGHPMAELFGLTTILQRVDEQARLAGAMVLGMLRGDVEGDDGSSIVLEPMLVVRGTTGPA
jgi:DNA-binding LacI/PurR family transcriptional regulator